MNAPVVVTVCGDPGGANAVAPVIEALRVDGRVTVRALAYRQARALWAKRHLVFEELTENISFTSIGEILHDLGLALLLTGTSFNSIELEKQFIAMARNIALPSLAVLDFWSNYAQRFEDDAGRLVYMPDRIAVMD